MSDHGKLVVLRLTGTDRMEGVWLRLQPGTTPNVSRFFGPSAVMVPTGQVEWNGNECAEVYVPDDKLAEYRAEFDLTDSYS